MSHHHHSDYIDVVSAKGPAQLSGRMKGIFIVMMIVGFATFIFRTFVGDSPRAGWISFLHNLYFFTCLSAAGVVVAAIIQVARAMWGRPIKRYAEAMGAFLPVTLIGIIILWIGATINAGNPENFIYEWMHADQPNPELFHNKAWWLQTNFVFGRQLLFMGLLTWLAFKFRGLSLRPDLILANQKNGDLWQAPAGAGDLDEEVAASQKKQSYWGVFYCFAFAYCISMFAYDLIMSLDYRWISTMFGGWNFTTSMLTAWGTLWLLAKWMGNRFGVGHYMHKKLYHDLGKLTFGFTVVWGYLFFAQLNVIWYGNLSHETGYLLTRIQGQPWSGLAWTVGVMVFLFPFFVGLSKKIKMSAYYPILLTSSLVGVWLERFVLIAPATWYFDRHKGVFEGITGLLFTDVLVFLGFLGLFCLLFTRALYKNPIMVISDPRLDDGINRH